MSDTNNAPERPAVTFRMIISEEEASVKFKEDPRRVILCIGDYLEISMTESAAALLAGLLWGQAK